MPRSRPPRTTRAGSLHARPGALDPSAPGETPQLPLGALTVPEGRRWVRSPLLDLELPERAPGPRPEIAVRPLDAGRLYAPRLVAAAGWETAIALSADLSRSLRVRLSPAGGIQRPVPGTKSPHVDKDGRIVVPSGLRNFLALQPGDLLLAWTIGDGIVHLAPASVLPAVFAAFDEGIPDQSVLHGTEGDATATGATVHRVDEARARRPRPTRTPSRQGP